MRRKKYTTTQILEDDNLIFDLTNDTTFKRVFLNKDNSYYLKNIIDILFNLNSNENYILLNTEIPNNKSKSSYSDLILKCGKYEYIVEMNGSPYSDLTFYKNHHYLLKEHSRRNYKGNIYGKNNYTILINIDNYDLLKKNKLIYKSKLKYDKYNNVLYKNIKSYSINLDYIRYKYYNYIELNELEKLLIIFVEQRKDKILSITQNKCVKELIEYMDILKMEEQFIATYDREEYEQGLKEEFENNVKEYKNNIKNYENKIKKYENNVKKLESDKTKLESDKTKLESDKTKLESDRSEFNNEKIEFAKELKLLGIPINKIRKLTKLSLEQIHML